MTYRLAADIGGTFTDVVLEFGERRWSTKVLTTPNAPEQGLLTGIDELIALASITPNQLELFVHGTTLATNALIERKGAKTAFLTTAGFKSLLDMGYEKRFDHYDLMIDPVPPIVAAEHRFEVPERLAADGRTLVPLDGQAIRALAADLTNYDAIAIGFLHSFAHPEHEVQTAEILASALSHKPTICLSSEVCPEIREYERFVTTCANATVRPLMAGYLARLETALEARGIACPLFLMMSGGGLTTIDQARRYPIRLVESGPAGGAILAGHIARACGLDEVLAFDMGGTTAKICLLKDGEPERARLFEVARSYRNLKGSGWPVRIPVIDMVEIGAGGGSIARVDALSQITVGPDSAGADPGPVAYGLGGQNPTVTDANLCLGKIAPEHFAGGKIQLDRKAATAALSHEVGDALDLSDAWPAAGVVEIVEENMANAARVHAIEKGRDISACTMIAFGGGAPLHACRLAEKLGIDRIIVPKGAGVGSAIGFLRAAIAFEVTRTSMMRLEAFCAASANDILHGLEAAAAQAVRPALGDIEPKRLRKLAMRYTGQGHELDVVLIDRDLTSGDVGDLRDTFEQQYRLAYGVTLPSMGVEIVAWSVLLQGPKPNVQETPITADQPASQMSERELFDTSQGQASTVPVFWRSELPPDFAIEGPAIIAEDETSTVIARTFRARLDEHGYIHMERRR